MGCNPGPHRDLAVAHRRNQRVQSGEFERVVEELASTITCEQGPHALGAANSFRSMARQAGPDMFLRQNTALFSRPDRRPDLVRIACPTLVVWGREDRLAAPQHGADMAGLIPDARLAVLDRCGICRPWSSRTSRALWPESGSGPLFRPPRGAGAQSRGKVRT